MVLYFNKYFETWYALRLRYVFVQYVLVCVNLFLYIQIIYSHRKGGYLINKLERYRQSL